MSSDTPTLDAALTYASFSWRVLPCHTIVDGQCSCGRSTCESKGKHPRTRHGLKDATADPERIRRLGAGWERCNLAVVTGPVSGLAVVDVDNEDAFDVLVEAYGPLPDTVEQITGRGRQLFFRYPKDGAVIRNKTALRGRPGVDIRGDGGYVIVPPSRHATGKVYVWESSTDVLDGGSPVLAELPAAWLRLLADHAAPDVVQENRPDGDRLSVGRRHDGMFTLAAGLRAKGLSPEAIKAAIHEENGLRCDPPLDVDEVDKIAASAAKYEVDVARAITFTRTGERTPDAKAAAAAAPWVPFPTDVLPDPLRSYVDEGGAALGCDRAMVAMPALAVCAGAIGLTRAVELKTSWREYAILWPAVVSESGTLKSPAQDLAVRPLHDVQADRFREYEDERVAWQRDCERYETERADYRRAKLGARGELPEKPEPPACTRYIVSDATVEALAPILKENPRGLLLARDELGGWLGSFNAYKQKGGDLQSWLELHRGGPLLVDRKTGRQTIHVARAGVSVCGTIQPGVLQRALTPEFFSSGLAARLLLVMPPRQDKRWSNRVVSAGTRDMYTALLRRLLELGFAADSDDEPRPVIVPMTPDAREVWVGWYDHFAGIQAAAVGPLAASLSKLEAYGARLSLLFCVVRSVWARGAGTGPVEAQDVERGTAMTDWLANEQERVYAMLQAVHDDEAPEDRGRRELADLIREKGGRITPRELQQGCRRFRAGVADAEAALNQLVAAGSGRWTYAKGQGRPSRVFELVYGVNVNENPAGAPENGGFVTVDSVATSAVDEVGPPVVHDSDGPDDSDRREREAVQAVEAEVMPGRVHDVDDVPDGWTSEAWGAACGVVAVGCPGGETWTH